jgi:hypothetical protein
MVTHTLFIMMVLSWLSHSLPGQSDYLLSPVCSRLVMDDYNERVRSTIVLPALDEFQSRWYEAVLVVSVAPPRFEDPYHVFILTHNSEHGYSMKAVEYFKKRDSASSAPSVTVVKEVVLDPFPPTVAQKIRDSVAGALASIRFRPSELQMLDGYLVEVALWQDASLRCGQAGGSADGPHANLMIGLMLTLGQAVLQESAGEPISRWAGVLEITEKITKKFAVAPPPKAPANK